MDRSFHLLIGDSLTTTARRIPNRTAVVFRDERVTYGEIEAGANQVAHAALAHGLRRQDTVALFVHNCPEFLELWFGLPKAGIIHTPVSHRWKGEEVAHQIIDSESKAVFASAELVEALNPHLDHELSHIPREKFVILEGTPPPGMTAFEDFIRGFPTTVPGAPVDENDVFCLRYTSGTTGRPKGSMITQRRQWLIYNFIALEYGISEEDVTLIVAPLSHAAGAFSGGSVQVGAKIVLSREFNPEDVLRTIQEEKGTNIFMVPSMYGMILRLPEEVKSKYDLSSMRTVSSAASPLPTRLKEEIIKFFPNAGLHEWYGSTEYGFVSNLRPPDQLRKVRCVGQPKFGNQIRLLDGEKRDVPVGEPGDIYVRGPCIQLGYFKHPEADAEATVEGGWLCNGDVGRMDEEGYLYIVDRKADMIISGGYNVYPVEIENVLMLNPKVQEACVFGVPDEKWGEAVKAQVILKPNEETTPEELIAFANQHLAGYKVPKSVDFVDDFPRLATGKVLKREIRQSFWEGQEATI
ncbi:AMP-binding protein [Thermodesulfobacteriota bacterium]